MTDKVTSESHDTIRPTTDAAESNDRPVEGKATARAPVEGDLSASHAQSENTSESDAAGAASSEPTIDKETQTGSPQDDGARRPASAAGSYGNPMPEVPDLLARIAGRVSGDETNEEHQEEEAADDLRERLRSLKEQAIKNGDDARQSGDGPFANAEATLMKLSQQVEEQEDLGPEQALAEAEADVVQSDLGVVAGSPETPWNEDAAETLTTHCEAAGLSVDDKKDELLIGAPDHEASSAPVSYVYMQPNMPEAGPQWFAQRFDSMSKRLDAVVGDNPIQASSDLASLLERFDALEVRISELLEQTAGEAAGAASGGTLNDIELCIAEIAGQLEATTAELARIEGIERQIGDVAKAIADQRDAAMAVTPSDGGSPFDMAALADLVADKVGARPVSQLAGEPGDARAAVGDIGELSATMKEFVREHRSEGEHTNAVLDTMQQTIIRVLDRMEALESGAPRAGAGFPHAPGQAVNASVASANVSAAPRPAVSNAPNEASAKAAEPTAEPINRAAPASVAPAATESPENVSLDRLQRVMGQLDGTDRATATPSEPASPSTPVAAGGTGGQRNRADFVKAARQAAAKANQPADTAPAETVETDRSKFAAAARQAAANANKRMANEDSEEEEIGATHDGFSLSSLGARLGAVTGSKKAAAKSRTRTRLLVAALAIVAVGLGATKFMMSTSGEPAREQLQSSRIQQGSNVAGQQVTASPVKVAVSPRELGAGSFAQGVKPGTVAYSPEANSMVQPVSVPPVSANGPVSGGAGSVSRKALPSALVGPLSMRLAAANGDPSAEFQVAARYADGKGVKQDLDEALKWYRRSAARGFALSQYRLGTFYERGLSVTKDVQRARVWYQRAASLGNVKAMHNLAVLAAGSSAGKPDYATAAKWFTAAADRGLGDSQFNLAILHRNGLGVPQDDKQAYTWFSRAGAAGDKEALRRMTEVETKLGKDQVAVLRAEMSRWTRKPTSKMANDPHYAGQAWQRKNS